MTALLIPEWAKVLARRDQAAVADVVDGFNYKRYALLFVADDERQRYVPFTDIAKASDAGLVAVADGASEADVLAVVEQFMREMA